MIFSGFVGCLLGCPVTASLGEDAASTGRASSSSGANRSTSTGSEAGSTEVGSAAVTTSGDTTSSSTSASPTAGEESSWETFPDPSGDPSSGDWPSICDGPVVPGCQSCLRENCCAALEQCVTTPLCSCLLGCLEFAPDFLSCLDIPACNGGPDADALLACAEGGCADACGF